MLRQQKNGKNVAENENENVEDKFTKYNIIFSKYILIMASKANMNIGSLPQKYMVFRAHGSHKCIRCKKNLRDYTVKEKTFIKKYLNIILFTNPGDLCFQSKKTWRGLF